MGWYISEIKKNNFVYLRRYDATLACPIGKASLKCSSCGNECKKSGTYRNKNRVVQRFYCVNCGKSFSELQPLDTLRLDHDKVVQIVKLLTEGLGVRATARFVNCDAHTVLNVLETVGEKCGRLHDKLVRNLQTGSLQIDELWSRVYCSQKRAGEGNSEIGDQYTYLALTAREKFIVSYFTGKRNEENTELFVKDVASRFSPPFSAMGSLVQRQTEVTRAASLCLLIALALFIYSGVSIDLLPDREINGLKNGFVFEIPISVLFLWILILTEVTLSRKHAVEGQNRMNP